MDTCYCILPSLDITVSRITYRQSTPTTCRYLHSLGAVLTHLSLSPTGSEVPEKVECASIIE
jgi:hypothetical protein